MVRGLPWCVLALSGCGRFNFDSAQDAGDGPEPTCPVVHPDATTSPVTDADLSVTASGAIADGTYLYVTLFAGTDVVREGVVAFTGQTATLAMPRAVVAGVSYTVLAFEDNQKDGVCEDAVERPYTATFVGSGSAKVISLTTRAPSCAGTRLLFDLDGDGCINVAEWCRFQVEYLGASLRVDLNGSGVTDLSDLALFAAAYQPHQCP